MIRIERPAEDLRPARRGATTSTSRSRRAGLRLPRPQRRRQDDDDPHDDRAPRADARARCCSAATTSGASPRPPRRSPATSPISPFLYDKLTGARVPALRRRPLRRRRADELARRAAASCSTSFELARARRRAGRDLLARHEAAPGARRRARSTARASSSSTSRWSASIPQGALELRRLLARLAADGRHDLPLDPQPRASPRSSATRIGILDHGRLVALGTLDELRAARSRRGRRDREARRRSRRSSSPSSARATARDGGRGAPRARGCSRRATSRAARRGTAARARRC